MTDTEWNADEAVSRTNFLVPTNDPVIVVKKSRSLNLFVAGVMVTLLLALVAVTFSLAVVSSSRNDLQHQLTCRSGPAAIVDNKTSDELAAIGTAQATTLQALAALQTSNKTTLDEQIALVPQIVKDLKTSSDALATAVKDREDSLKTCK